MIQRLVSPVHGLGQPLVNRSQRLSFRLDGIEIKGYAGDTVLSAALAAGIGGAGRFGGSPLRLGAGLAPNVRAWEDRDGSGVPMALYPVADGADLVTVGIRGTATRRMGAQMRGRPPEVLRTDLNALMAATGMNLPAPEIERTDLLVIGGGVAGMSAALAAAERGESVILVERRGRLGGDAGLFGNREGEDPVLDAVASLESAMKDRPEIQVRLYSEAIDANADGVLTQHVAVENAVPAVRTTRIAALHVVLATGCADRLPVYPGNRLPGVIGLAEAYHMAGAYGIWPDTPTLFAGGTNALYRLATLSKESGAELVRLVDHRPAPHSRFIDFAKASGVPQEFGTRISAVSYTRRGRLAVETTLSGSESGRGGRAVYAAGSVVHSDGWRPRLMLWTRLGGGLAWNGTQCIPEGSRVAAGITLAGSVAGLITNSGCIESGRRAIVELYGDEAAPVPENLLADYVESPDAPRLQALMSKRTPAFASSARVLVAMPTADEARKPKRGGEPGAGMAGAMDLETIETLTSAALSPAERFADICVERLVSPETVTAKTEIPEPVPERKDGIPDYVRGRFAEPLRRIALISEDGREFEPGLLVFAESGEDRPEQALGVTIAAKDRGGMAVLSEELSAGRTRVAVRDGARTISAVLVD